MTYLYTYIAIYKYCIPRWKSCPQQSIVVSEFCNKMFVLAIKHVKLVKYDKYFLFFSDSEKLENIAITQYCVKSVRSFFWSVFSCIRSEHGDLLRKYLYSVRIQEDVDQKKLRIWTLFTQCRVITIIHERCIQNQSNMHNI